MKTIIKWQTGMFMKADPVKCYEEITNIGDEVTPEQLVEKGKDPHTELFKCFTREDADAANKYRLWEARQILRQLIVITRPDPEDEMEHDEPIQFRLMMKNETNRGTGYKQTLVMIRDEDEYRKLLNMALEELRTFKRKYSMLSELREILDLIN